VDTENKLTSYTEKVKNLAEDLNKQKEQIKDIVHKKALAERQMKLLSEAKGTKEYQTLSKELSTRTKKLKSLLPNKANLVEGLSKLQEHTKPLNRQGAGQKLKRF
jgi:hypothetical protein